MINFFSYAKKELEKNNVFYFRAKISAGSSENKFCEILEDEEKTVKIKIKKPAKDGEANREIEKILGKNFKCNVKIISGARGAIKLIKLYREN
jgi:uncharacterized protein (TIGR00251 family)